MLVRDLMTREVVTCDAGATVRDAAERMLDAGIGSVLITKDGTPLAILTETDIVRAGVVTGRALDDIPVDKAASHPLRTVGPDAIIRSAVKRVVKHRHRSPQSDGRFKNHQSLMSTSVFSPRL